MNIIRLILRILAYSIYAISFILIAVMVAAVIYGVAIDILT